MRARVLVGAAAVAAVLLAGCGSSPSSSGTTTTTSMDTTTTAMAAGLQPAALGSAQCQAGGLADGSGYGQIAVSGATCAAVPAVATAADAAAGAGFSSGGYTCTSSTEGPSTTWSAAFGGTYYAYSCADGSDELAFNWGRNYVYGELVGPSQGASGTLEPAPLGDAQCQAGRLDDQAVYAQITASNAACSTADDLAQQADAAKGHGFSWNGFECTATNEGAGSTWAAAWAHGYVAYTCADGDEQVAFTWGYDYVYK